MSLAGVRRPVLPRSVLTTNADTANPTATISWRRIGRYSRSIRCSPGSYTLFYANQMAVLSRDRLGQGRGKPLVFLAVLLYRPSRHQVLQFLIRTQPQHLLAS